MRDVALRIDLRLLSIGRRGQCDMAIHARARTSSDPADHAALPRRVAALKHHDDARPGGLHPGLQAGELDLELGKLLLELLAFHRAGRMLRADLAQRFGVIFTHRHPPLKITRRNRCSDTAK